MVRCPVADFLTDLLNPSRIRYWGLHDQTCNACLSFRDGFEAAFLGRREGRLSY
jgi:hypothetical protein